MIGWTFRSQVRSHCVIDDVFSYKEIEEIKNIKEKVNYDQAIIENPIVKGKMIRQSMISWLEINKCEWLYEKLENVVRENNYKWFGYDILGLSHIQITKYEDSYRGHYSKHIDLIESSTVERKLTVVICLNNMDEMVGGDLCLHKSDIPKVITQKLGRIVIFPSYTVHEVTPVTKGTRSSLVTWAIGPSFK